MTSSGRQSLMAGMYDRIVDPMLAGLRGRALEFLPPEPGWRVLDVGCGTGAGLQRYLEAGCEVVGVEVSQAMIEQARYRTAGQAELHLTDGDRLPFDNDQFDLVTASLVLHGIPKEERRRFLEEMLRVAHPEGRVFITEFRFGRLRGWRGPATKALATTVEGLSGHFAHFRTFRQCGGVPGVLQEVGVPLIAEKPIGGGTFGFYLARPLL